MGRACRMWMHGWGGRGALHDQQNASNVAARACRSCSQGKFPPDLSFKLEVGTSLSSLYTHVGIIMHSGCTLQLSMNGLFLILVQNIWACVRPTT